MMRITFIRPSAGARCAALVLGIWLAAWPGTVRALAEIAMQVGETRVLTHAGVSRVAVGNGQVMNAVAVDGKDVVVFAREEGESSLHVWAGSQRSAYTVRVAPAQSRRARGEVNALLARIPGARAEAVGDAIVIEGDDLSDADRARIAALAERYPQVVDFTGKVGWDRMVLLDVQVVELPRARVRELGIRWDAATQGGIHAGLGLDAASSARVSQRPGTLALDTPLRAAPAVGYLGLNALLSSRIDLLAQSGEAVVLAQPQLLARSGATAEFLAGGEVPYATTDRHGKTSTTFKPYGISLRITPTIEASGTVRSRIEVEASSVDAMVTAHGGPALKTRRASTEFNVRSGHTLVIGGFLSRERTVDTNGVPGLGDLPLLGGLFRSRRESLRETELAIFVTPVVVSDSHAGIRAPVGRSQALLQQAFPESPRMFEPARDIAAVDRLLAPEHAAVWDPYGGAGSQWNGGNGNSGIDTAPPGLSTRED
jgi:pilus assembly protein CpaC